MGSLKWPKTVEDSFRRKVDDFLSNGWYSLGKYTNDVENMWVGDSERTITVSSATSGLAVVSLMAFQMHGKKRVVIPEMTVPNVEFGVKYGIINCVKVDVGTDFVLSAIVALGLCSIDTVVYVATGGIVGKDFEDFLSICRERNVFVIGDMSHAHGCKFKGVPLHKYFDAAVWSFYSTKILPVGEGGIVWAKDKRDADFIRKYVNAGKERASLFFRGNGFNFRLSEIQAVAISAFIDNSEGIYERRRLVARRYLDFGIRSIQSEIPDLYSTYYKYPVMLKVGVKADTVYGLAEGKGIKLTGRVHDANRDSLTGKFNLPYSSIISGSHVCMPLFNDTSEKEIVEASEFIKPFIQD
ncbi:MAG: DegT/DnrJ/EryC1/StrS family aminotransferase [Nitrospirae bacterium]|nr:DegT/DnrJ/EryC1/StrS family aminotransferase [Nitrospirota bacterium]